MNRIEKIFLVPIQGSYYCDDISALQAQSIPEAERWKAPGKTPGFKKVREIAEGVSIGLSINHSVYWGDCIAVSYGGKSGRGGLFRSLEAIHQIKKDLLPSLMGMEITDFKGSLKKIENLPGHSAVHYGLTQALLRSVAGETKKQLFEVIIKEWDLSSKIEEIPIQGSSGNNRYENADKMILNRLSGLPHSQVDDISNQLGLRGEKLVEYLKWLCLRIKELGGSEYSPIIHFDVHGSIGKIFQGDVAKIVDYLTTLENLVHPYRFRIESAWLGNTREQQIEIYGKLKSALKSRSSKVELVADEWANNLEDISVFADAGVVDMIHIKMPDLGGIQNSIEAVLHCKKKGVQSLLGGSCIETEISTMVSVHLALATQPTALLAKPGMGIDEAIMLVRNEMGRALEISSKY